MSTETTPLMSKDDFTFTIRRATLSDARVMASLASTSFFHQKISDFITPNRFAYMQDNIYGYEARIRSRFADPRNISYLAVSNTGIPVGYVQFIRCGGEQKSTWYHTLCVRFPTWVRSVWDRWTWVNRAEDRKALERILAQIDVWEGKKEFENRYHILSMVTSVGHQKRGIGSAVMKKALERAQKEGVPVCLEASPDGEFLYRRLGFKMLARFKELYDESMPTEEGGGLMVWTPEGWQGSNVEEV